MNTQIRETDIIVWQGVIATYGVVKPLMDKGDEFRIATTEEALRYLNTKI